MTNERDLERAEARRDEQIDDRLTRGVCIRCEGPMPESFRTVSPKPAKCPACAPIQWLEFSANAFVGNEWNYSPLVGHRVDSPVGIGHLTGTNARGFPMVDEVAVTWIILLPEEPKS